MKLIIVTILVALASLGLSWALPLFHNDDQGWTYSQGCIREHNDQVDDNFEYIEDCRAKCDTLIGCKSVEWHFWGRCVLSLTDTRDALSVFEAPCRSTESGTESDKEWVYSERRYPEPDFIGPPPPAPAAPPAPAWLPAPAGPAPVSLPAPAGPGRAHHQGSPPQISGSSNSGFVDNFASSNGNSGNGANTNFPDNFASSNGNSGNGANPNFPDNFGG